MFSDSHCSRSLMCSGSSLILLTDLWPVWVAILECLICVHLHHLQGSRESPSALHAPLMCPLLSSQFLYFTSILEDWLRTNRSMMSSPKTLGSQLIALWLLQLTDLYVYVYDCAGILCRLSDSVLHGSIIIITHTHWPEGTGHFHTDLGLFVFP